MNSKVRVATLDWEAQPETARRLRIRQVPQTIYIKSRKQYNITSIALASEAADIVNNKKLREHNNRKIPEAPSAMKLWVKAFSRSTIDAFKFSPLLFIGVFVALLAVVVWIIYKCTEEDYEDLVKKYQ